MFKLTVLGNCGGYPAAGGASSGYLLTAGNANILLDLGSGVFSRLLKYIRPEKLSAVILSHTHFDHTSDLGVLDYYLLINGFFGLNVYCPKTDLKFDPKDYPRLKFIWIEDCPALDIDGVSFSFYPMRHPVSCYGLRASYRNANFAYTGDTDMCESVKELAKADVLLADGAFLQRDYIVGGPHMSVEMCCRLAREYGCRVLITHLSEKYGASELKSAVSEYENCAVVNQFDEILLI